MKTYKIELTIEELDEISVNVLKDQKNKKEHLKQLDEDKAYIWDKEYYFKVKEHCKLIEKIYKKLIQAYSNQ